MGHTITQLPRITLLKPIQALAPGTIVLRRKTRRERIKERIERTRAFRFITSPRLTAPLAGVAGTLIGGPLIGLKAFLAGGLGAGILSVSPKAAKFISEKVLRPEKAGVFIGTAIEDPSILRPKEITPIGVKEKVIETLKEGGPIAAAGALGIGVGALARELAKRIKGLKPGVAGLPGLPGLPGVPGVSLPAAMAPVISQPLGPAKKPEPEKEKLPVATLPSINNRIVFKPVIDIRFSKSHKFINQQLLIR